MAEIASKTGSDNRTSAWSRGIGRDVLLGVSALLMAVTLYMIFFWVPTEQNLGISQRIFYFHVPLAWLGMISIVVVAVASFLHLITGKDIHTHMHPPYTPCTSPHTTPHPTHLSIHLPMFGSLREETFC